MPVVSSENDAKLTQTELEDEVATLPTSTPGPAAGSSWWQNSTAETASEAAARPHSGSPGACALSPRAAREHVRVARALEELPLIRTAFSRGELSYAKVRPLTRVATPESEEELLDLARVMTASQLERAIRGYRSVSRVDANALRAHAYVGWYWEEDGSLVIKGKLAPEDGAVFLRALEASRDSFRKEDRGSAEPRPTNAEALVAMAEHSLSGEESATAERYQVVVHVDAAALASEGEGGCALEDGPALAAETARRLACDASAVQVTERNGEPLSVGRRTRTIPPALRRALRARDHGCRFPGCDNRRFVDAHHVQHWGGPILDAPRLPPGSWQELMELDAGMCESGTGERMDLDLAVATLQQVLG